MEPSAPRESSSSGIWNEQIWAGTTSMVAFQLWVKITCDCKLVPITEYLNCSDFLREAVSLQCKVSSVYTVLSKGATLKAVLAVFANLTSKWSVKKQQLNSSTVLLLCFNTEISASVFIWLWSLLMDSIICDMIRASRVWVAGIICTDSIHRFLGSSLDAFPGGKDGNRQHVQLLQVCWWHSWVLLTFFYSLQSFSVWGNVWVAHLLTSSKKSYTVSSLISYVYQTCSQVIPVLFCECRVERCNTSVTALKLRRCIKVLLSIMLARTWTHLACLGVFLDLFLHVIPLSDNGSKGSETCFWDCYTKCKLYGKEAREALQNPFQRSKRQVLDNVFFYKADFFFFLVYKLACDMILF